MKTRQFTFSVEGLDRREEEKFNEFLKGVSVKKIHYRIIGRVYDNGKDVNAFVLVEYENVKPSKILQCKQFIMKNAYPYKPDNNNHVDDTKEMNVFLQGLKSYSIEYDAVHFNGKYDEGTYTSALVIYEK